MEPVVLPALTARTHLARNIEESDKLILPVAFLNALLNEFGAQLPNPVVLRVTNGANDRVTHCGVLEFSAPDERAYFPDHVWENLALEPDQLVQILVLADAPKVAFMQVQPLVPGLGSITEAKATLELVLHKFTCLTLNDRVPLALPSGLMVPVKITKLEPDTYGCIVDTDVKIDFLPLDDSTNADSVHVTRGEPIRSAGRFKWTSDERPAEIRVRTQGELVVFASWSTETPSASDCDFALLANADTRKALHVVPGLLNLCIQGTGEVSIADPPTQKRPHEADGDECPHCQARVPPATLSLHVARCARTNWRCPTCRVNMPRSQEATHKHCACGDVLADRHDQVVHGFGRCDACGDTVSARELTAHRGGLCTKACRWCTVRFPKPTLGDHEKLCGNKTIPCDQCGRSVRISQRKLHVALNHRERFPTL